jgi:hypothetical protein
MSLEVPEGVQAFNLWTIWIMARMWERFPRKQFFACEHDRVYATENPAAAPMPFGPSEQQSSLVQQFCPTMDWLMAQGYLKGKTNHAGHYAMISLQERSFSVLNQIPRSIAPTLTPKAQKSLGALMRDAVVSKGTESLAGTLITAMVTAWTGGRSSPE